MSNESSSEEAKEEIRKESLNLFPEREGKRREFIKEPISSFFYGNPDRQRLQCEKNVIDAIETAPLVKLMMSALKSSGCEIDYGRHFTCESCGPDVTGGYDPTNNQLVICYNRCNKYTTRGVLAHELLHMFDVCRANLDFNNIEHVACTEIRAANLMHCSIASGMFASSVSLFDLKKAHQKCVKQKAVASLLAVRPSANKAEMWRIVDKVFDKCYNDLEPVGRRVRRNSQDMNRAYRERYHYGYY